MAFETYAREPVDGFVARLDSLAVQLRLAPFDGGEHRVRSRLENHPGDGLALAHHADANGKKQHVVGKIVRSVYRVDDPPDLLAAPRGLLEHLAALAFLGDETVIGIVLFDPVHDDFL